MLLSLQMTEKILQSLKGSFKPKDKSALKTLLAVNYIFSAQGINRSCKNIFFAKFLFKKQ